MLKIKKFVVVSGIVIFLGSGSFLGFSVLKQNSSENPASPREEWKATLFVAPEKGTFIVAEDFQATVNVDTNMEINAASGELHFPIAQLEVIGLSKEESIFELWVAEPSYSNTDGILRFSGGLPTPGFKGSKGKILTITFKPREAGKAELKFEKATVFANDGKGTDILKELKGAFWAIITPIASDLSNDGSVGLIDLSILLSNWGIPKNPRADINKDGKVDIADFSILIFNLGQ